MRLQKYIAQSGITSRRKAEEMIVQNRVKVNGKIVNELGYKVDLEDSVKVDNKIIKIEGKKVYILLNKPVGYVTTSKDQFERDTVMDLIKGIKERIYPVGRLDYDTSGMLILTNDGDFTLKMTHPKNGIKKTYLAKVNGIPKQESLDKMRNGIRIENYTTAKAEVDMYRVYSHNSTVKITLHEGKNRQVRKMCEKIGHSVRGLKRIQIAEIKLGHLESGKWRYLTTEEVDSLTEG